VEEILKRVWDHLIGRFSGPMNFRLIMQPAVAAIFAIREGLRDAREGCPAFFWAALTDSGHRRVLLREGWKHVGKVFILAIVLDSIYQLMVHRGVYVLELLITATVLAIIPYVLIRGPINRIARIARRKAIRDRVTEDRVTNVMKAP
jgi:hypothetical protein